MDICNTSNIKYNQEAVCGNTFLSDIIDLFKEKKYGHMGCWEYSEPIADNDCAGGQKYWESLIMSPGNYYLLDNEVTAISKILNDTNLISMLSSTSRVVELGTGCSITVKKKTVPLISLMASITNYTAVDIEPQQAYDAAEEVKLSLPVVTSSIAQDFIQKPISGVSDENTLLLLWGSSLGNLEGREANNPILPLTKNISNIARGLLKDDLFMFTIDTESNKQKILDAYNEPALKASILSVLYVLDRDYNVSGSFSPNDWIHEPVWFSEVGQCAHIIYPICDQFFEVNGVQIDIPAHKRFITNNSYKFTKEIMSSALCNSGMECSYYMEEKSMAICVARVK